MLLAALVIAGGCFLLGRSSVDKGASQARVSRAVHRAAEKALARAVHENEAIQQREERLVLPQILREYGANEKILAGGSLSHETEEALIVLRRALLGEINSLNPILVRYNPRTGEYAGLEMNELTNADLVDLNRGIRAAE